MMRPQSQPYVQKPGKWVTYLTSIVNNPGKWGRTPLPFDTANKALNKAGTIRRGVATTRPVTEQSGYFETRVQEVQRPEGNPVYYIWTMWVPSKKDGLRRPQRKPKDA